MEARREKNGGPALAVRAGPILRLLAIHGTAQRPFPTEISLEPCFARQNTALDALVAEGLGDLLWAKKRLEPPRLLGPRRLFLVVFLWPASVGQLVPATHVAGPSWP